MPSTLLTCPDDTELLALAMGEPARSRRSAHTWPNARAAKRGSMVSRPRWRCSGRTTAGRITLTLDHERADAGLRPVDQRDAPGIDRLGGRSWLGIQRPTSATTTHSASATMAPFPAAIGKYLVVGRFPPSGQAEVFRVVHPHSSRNGCSSSPRSRSAPDGRSGIIEEGKILSELEHPYLVRVYDLDFLDDRPYLVMEYVRGRNLEQFAAEESGHPALGGGAGGQGGRRGGLCPSARDHSPRHQAEEHPDRRVGRAPADRLRHGPAEHAWSDDRKQPDGGTFAFMAPEQARFESPDDRQKVGPRSDVFALGATLYFLLTGQAPFCRPDLERSLGPRPPLRL